MQYRLQEQELVLFQIIIQKLVSILIVVQDNYGVENTVKIKQPSQKQRLQVPLLCYKILIMLVVSFLVGLYHIKGMSIHKKGKMCWIIIIQKSLNMENLTHENPVSILIHQIKMKRISPFP